MAAAVSLAHSLGYVGEKDYQQLAELRKQRNAAAHLRQFDPPEAGTIRHVLAVVERMVNGQYVPVDQMVEWYVVVMTTRRTPPSRLASKHYLKNIFRVCRRVILRKR